MKPAGDSSGISALSGGDWDTPSVATTAAAAATAATAAAGVDGASAASSTPAGTEPTGRPTTKRVSSKRVTWRSDRELVAVRWFVRDDPPAQVSCLPRVALVHRVCLSLWRPAEFVWLMMIILSLSLLCSDVRRRHVCRVADVSCVATGMQGRPPE